MRILITGASGFLGSHLSRASSARGDEVLGFGRDLDPETIRAAPVDLVHHLAYDVDALRAGEEDDRRVNIEGAVRVVEAAADAGARHVVLASSGFVYGESEVLPIPETQPLRPGAPNGVSKLRIEQAVGEACARRAVVLTVLRYANLYGGGDRDRSVIARFARALLEERPAQIAGNGAQTRDFIHVDDAVAANLAVTDQRLAGAWNVGTGVETSILEAWERVQEVLGRRGSVEWLAPRGDDRSRNALDGLKLRTAAGLAEPVSLAEGVRRSWGRV